MQRPHQLSLFEAINAQAVKVGGFVAAMKAAMRRALAESNLSRAQVVDRMNELAAYAGKPLTTGRKKAIHPDTLDKWLSDEERGQMPSMYAMQIFMDATGSIAPLACWLGFWGYGVMTPEAEKRLEYAGIVLAEKAKAKEEHARAKRKKRLEEELLEK